MSGIFISYRRRDTAYIAGRLHDRLAAHFGPEQIFRDIETLKPGADFGQRIDEAVGSCDAFLAIVGDGWLLDRNPPGKRPLGIPRDWVQKEIEAALARPDLLLIPVLVEDAAMPDEAELPDPIKTLARRNAMEITDRRWDYDVQQLIEVLEEVVQRRPAAVAGGRGATDPGPPPPRQPVPVPLPLPLPSPELPLRRGRVPTWMKVAVPVLALLVVVAAAVLVANALQGESSGPEQTIASPGPTRTTSGRATTTRPAGVTTTTRVFSGPFTGKSGALTLTVQRVEAGSDRMRVQLLLVNGTSDGLTLPADGFSAVDDTDHSYKADPFSKEWPRTVPPRGRVTGVIDLVEPLRPGVTSMRMGWSTVFGSLQVKSIFVERVVVS